ncbi:hypothetical protein CYMTET_54482 [Cymbomonas tetramitiformis]|uniref:Right handed beta helix domain-containing protein n=1 Tax=Cymbomonas tetramitiformis TaxID=36881 RepID=A0AAE0EQN8_9CHLO|nr:hypothetical protein CYMTET_54482 [Cymbomonas tetramitiformis]
MVLGMRILSLLAHLLIQVIFHEFVYSSAAVGTGAGLATEEQVRIVNAKAISEIHQTGGREPLPSFSKLDHDTDGNIASYDHNVRQRRAELSQTIAAASSPSRAPATRMLLTGEDAGRNRGTVFTVTSGLCTLSSASTCILSPNYPSNYNSYDSCEFSVNGSAKLEVIAFETESNYDFFYVDSERYAGEAGPSDVLVNQYTSLRFTSDSSTEKAGFEICAVDDVIQPPPPPRLLSTSSSVFTVTSGLCTLSSASTCILSPNYPSNYNSYDSCEFSVNGSAKLEVIAFETESNYDFFYVDSERYAGEAGPSDVRVNQYTSLRFTSDSSNEKVGFEICAVDDGSPPVPGPPPSPPHPLPPPPLPPPCPEYPPRPPAPPGLNFTFDTSTSECTAYLTDAIHGQDHLEEALTDDCHTTIVLFVDIMLQEPLDLYRNQMYDGYGSEFLAIIQRSLYLRGECGALACTIDGGALTGAYGGWMGRFLDMEGRFNLTLSALHLTNFQAGVSHALVVHVYNSVFTQNTAVDGYGGALRAEQSANIYDSLFDSNTAAGFGIGGALYVKDAAHIHHSNFTGNVGFFGGAFYVQLYEVHISNSIFTNNIAELSTGSASGEGGAFHAGGAGYLRTVTMADCAFSGNWAGAKGGVFQGAFDTSEREPVEVHNCLFSNNSAATDGGVFHLTEFVELQISHSIFQNNSALDGGILHLTTDDLRNENAITAAVHINGSIFDYNSARNVGGIGKTIPGSPESPMALSIYDSTFSYSHCDASGGVFDLEYATVLIQGSNFISNSAAEDGGALHLVRSAVSIYNSTFDENAAQGGGGAMSASKTNATIQDSIFSSNQANVDGGAVAMTSGLLLVLDGSAFNDNVAGANGGALNLGDIEECRVSSTLLQGNSAEGGGAIFVRGSLVFMFAATDFEQNSAALQGGAVYCSSGSRLVAEDPITLSRNEAEQGGGLYISRSSVTFKSGGLLYGNAATKEGGAICMQSSEGGQSSERAELFASDVEIASNSVSEFSGGGISASANSRIELEHCLVHRNEAVLGSGGGIYAMNAALEVLAGSEISGNRAYTEGAGLALLGANMTLELSSSVIDANDAGAGGGGMAVSGGHVFIYNRSVISRNVGGNGGAILATSFVHLSIVDSEVVGNVAHATASMPAAGVLLMEGAAGEVEGALFEAQQGSALRAAASSSVVVRSTTFLNNSVASVGAAGAGLLGEERSTVVLEDCRFAHNVAVNGSAAHISGNASLARCTFESNEALANGPVYLSLEGLVDFSDSCFSGNSATNGAALFLVEPSAEVRSSFVQMKFEHNRAAGGASVAFWEPLDPFTNSTDRHPGCTNCTTWNNTAGYSTTDGYATPFADIRVNATQADAAGGWPLQQPVRGELVDLYGTVMSTASFEVRLDSVCPVTGTKSVVAESGVASFDGLTLSGVPGSQCAVSLATQVAAAEVVRWTSQPLRYCVPGELYDAGAGKCFPCPRDHLGFDNETNECVDCSAVDGIECTGGADYFILAGYWLPPMADSCTDAACLVERVLPCDVAAACDTAEDRRAGTGAHTVHGLQLCARQSGYFSGVKCGGTSTVVCGSGFYADLESTACVECPARQPLLAGIIASVIGTAVGILVILYLIFGSMKQQPIRSSSRRESDVGAISIELAQELAETWDGASGLVSDILSQPEFFEKLSQAGKTLGLALGYFQVIGQLGNVFRARLVPNIMLDFTSGLYVFSLDISTVFKTECVTYHFASTYSDMSPFWVTFYQAVLTPWALILGFGAMFRLYIKLYNHQNASLGTATLQQMNLTTFYQFASFTLFLETYFHPAVSTSIMHLFNCEDYWYEDTQHTESFLVPGSDIKCDTGEYHVGLFFAAFTICFYLSGFPVGVFLYMRRARQYYRCSFRTEDAVASWDWMIQRGWKPWQAASTRTVHTNPLSSGHVINSLEDLRQKGQSRVELYVPASAVTLSNEDVETEGKSLEVADDRKAISVDTSYSPRVRALLQVIHTEDEVEPCVQVTLQASSAGSVPEVCEGDAAPADARGAGTAHTLDQMDTDAPQEKVATVILDGGRSCQARVHMKFVEGKEGTLLCTPVTWLDNENVQKVLGSTFLSSFEDRHYFWQCYEIGRRVLQTGAVLLVEMLTDEETAVAYALLISVVALCVHLRFRPFIENDDDSLMTAILSSQAITQFGIICIKVTEKSKESLGYLMVLSQAVVIAYSIKLVSPAIQDLLQIVFRTRVVQRGFVLLKKMFEHPKKKRTRNCEGGRHCGVDACREEAFPGAGYPRAPSSQRSGVQRRWAKAIRETVLDGKANHFKVDGKDDAKLGKIIFYLKTQFENAVLDVSPFDFDDINKE